MYRPGFFRGNLQAGQQRFPEPFVIFCGGLEVVELVVPLRAHPLSCSRAARFPWGIGIR